MCNIICIKNKDRIAKKRYVDGLRDQKNTRLISSVCTSAGKKVDLYIAKKFQTIPPPYPNPRSIVPAIFLLALITMSRQITSERREPVGVSSSYIAVLFTIPRKTPLKARDFQRRNDQCVPTISISRRRLAAMKGEQRDERGVRERR